MDSGAAYGLGPLARAAENMPGKAGALLLPLPGSLLNDDPIVRHGGELWHCCSRDSSPYVVPTVCLGYWCPCALFGLNLQRAGVCRHSVTGCVGYILLTVVVTFLVSVVSSCSFYSFVECLSVGSDVLHWGPCTVVDASTGSPICSHSDLQLATTLAQMSAMVPHVRRNSAFFQAENGRFSRIFAEGSFSPRIFG